ncbi:hypothetical protein L1049_025213 [Liquidambar formosana]|uniref:Uncharacterized protein n=1 Tax=Liquidambar formosana TaxID=63359 RepID=A0AAP0S375_LIQFO
MSRCFPFPPPGYERARPFDEALIESIKIDNGQIFLACGLEMCFTAPERRGEGQERGRKEKNREKKEKEKGRKNGEIENKKHRHKRKHKDERSQEDQKGGDLQKRRENETEQFERSSLTEEYGRPVSSQNLCDSTDSTLNSNKRQKHSSPPNGRHNPGSIIRIRLPLQRHKDPEVLLPSKEQPCSTLTRIDAFVQDKCEAASSPGSEWREQPCSTSRTIDQEHAIELGNEKPCLASQASELPSDNVGATLASSLYGSGSSSLELQFRNLLENWIPPSIQTEHTDFEDQDWLFETTQNQNHVAKGPKACSDGLSCGNSTPWSRVCYLPEADIYALPFTIPF